MRTLLAILILCGAINMTAQDTRLAGPVSGLVFDRASRAVLQILGVPGSSYAGEALIADLDQAAVAPNGRLALTISQSRLHVIRGFDAAPAAAEIEGGMADAGRIVWNRTSSAAALYSAASGRLQLWRDDTGQIADLASLAGSVTALALSDNGSEVIAAVENQGIYVIAAGSDARLIAALSRPSALAVTGTRLFISDAERQEILRVDDFTGGGAPELFAGAALTAADPSGLAISKDQSLLLVTGRSSRVLTMFRISTGEVHSMLNLDFEPSGLEALTESLFRLNPGAEAGQPLQVAEARLDPAVWFVPMARADQ